MVIPSPFHPMHGTPADWAMMVEPIWGGEWGGGGRGGAAGARRREEKMHPERTSGAGVCGAGVWGGVR